MFGDNFYAQAVPP